MERDDETGMQYHSQRYYMPWLGRWERADPIGLGDGGNRFGYAQNRVVTLTDNGGLSGGTDGSTGSPMPSFKSGTPTFRGLKFPETPDEQINIVSSLVRDAPALQGGAVARLQNATLPGVKLADNIINAAREAGNDLNATWEARGVALSKPDRVAFLVQHGVPSQFLDAVDPTKLVANPALEKQAGNDQLFGAFYANVQASDMVRQVARGNTVGFYVPENHTIYADAGRFKQSLLHEFLHAVASDEFKAGIKSGGIAPLLNEAVVVYLSRLVEEGVPGTGDNLRWEGGMYGEA